MKFAIQPIDLFSVSTDHAFVHCVACDLRMGAGVAKEFVAYFRGMKPTLLAMDRQIGDVLFYHDAMPTPAADPSAPVQLANPVFNMITKELSSGKPTPRDFQTTLQRLKAEIMRRGIKKIAMPMIGCGLDGLSWPDYQKSPRHEQQPKKFKGVKTMIGETFADTDVAILVCVLPDSAQARLLAAGRL